MRLALAVLPLAALVACRGGEADSPARSEETRVEAFRVSPESFQVDRVGSGDGSLDPDGVPDAVFHATVDGPVNAVVLLALDSTGHPVGQWDTLTGGDKLPRGEGLFSPNGDSTFGLALYEGGVRLNHNDGSVSPLARGRHEIDLVAGVRDVDAARSAVLVLERPDGELVRGPAVAFSVPPPPAAPPSAGTTPAASADAGAAPPAP